MFVRIDSKHIVDNKLFDMCKTAEFNKDPTSVNIEFLDWWDRPETLLHQIFKQKVYDRGGYYCYEEDGKYLGGMGYYPFEEDENIFVLARMYICPDLGMKKTVDILMRLMTHVLITARDDYRAMILFMNSYNDWKLKCFDWAADPKRNKYTAFPNILTTVYDKKVRYKYTEQTAVYLDYNEDYAEEIEKCLQRITV